MVTSAQWQRTQGPVPGLNAVRAHPILNPLFLEGESITLKQPSPSSAQREAPVSLGWKVHYSPSKSLGTTLNFSLLGFLQLYKVIRASALQDSLVRSLTWFPHPPVGVSQPPLCCPSLLRCWLPLRFYLCAEHTSIPPTDPVFTCCKPRKELSFSPGMIFPGLKSSMFFKNNSAKDMFFSMHVFNCL